MNKKKIIRENVFETNSSSSHSVSICSDKNFILDTILPDQNGIISVSKRDFGWEIKKYNDAYTKLQYAYTDGVSKDLLKEILIEQTGCVDVIFNENDGYIDHSSKGTSPTIKEELRNFIFSKNSWLFTANDNSVPPNDFYTVEHYTEEGVVQPNYKYELVIPGINESYKLLYRTQAHFEKLYEFLNNLSYNSNTNEIKDLRYSFFLKKDYIYDMAPFSLQNIQFGYFILASYERIEKHLIKELDEEVYESLNFKELEPFENKFIEENIDNPDIVYKMKFELKKLK